MESNRNNNYFSVAAAQNFQTWLLNWSATRQKLIASQDYNTALNSHAGNYEKILDDRNRWFTRAILTRVAKNSDVASEETRTKAIGAKFVSDSHAAGTLAFKTVAQRWRIRSENAV